MTGKQFETVFLTMTRIIFTAVLAEAAILCAYTLTPVCSFAGVHLYRHIPLCMEYLAAGIVLYLLYAAAASLALRENHT